MILFGESGWRGMNQRGELAGAWAAVQMDHLRWTIMITSMSPSPSNTKWMRRTRWRLMMSSHRKRWSQSNGMTILEVKTIFSRINFISRLETSTWPLVCGWYRVATLCFVPYFFSKYSNCLAMKWDLPSLMTSLGTQNLGKIIFLNILITTPVSLVGEAMASIDETKLQVHSLIGVVIKRVSFRQGVG